MQPIEILIVEDNPADIYLAQRALRECTFPVNVSVAPDGAEAYRMLFEQRVHPDLILLDLNLPKMGGHELLTAIRTSGDRSTPVIIVSSSSHPADIQRSAENGANGYVRKQINLDEFSQDLLAAVRPWIAKAKRANGASTD